ncbi:MAG: 16S rRNA (cytosine(1402)-N(4))-methyltransferase [Lachnospiraceae bacterium]
MQRIICHGRLIGIDQDEDAARAAEERLKVFGEQVTIIRSNYCNMVRELNNIGVTAVDGILLDLEYPPTSWMHAERGFTLPGRCASGYADGSASKSEDSRTTS